MSQIFNNKVLLYTYIGWAMNMSHTPHNLTPSRRPHVPPCPSQAKDRLLVNVTFPAGLPRHEWGRRGRRWCVLERRHGSMIGAEVS